MGKNEAPQKEMYEEMKDTPWITQGRDIADIGGRGVISNADRVNVFDPAQRTQMEQLNEDVYSRAFEDLNKQYREGMNKYAAANYNRFGNLGSTPSAYLVDEYNRQHQRDMSNMAYNKAINYENLVDKELQRRYNTLGMYQTLYNMGQIPYELDVRNWQIRNTNKDRAYENALARANMNMGGSNLFGGIGLQGLDVGMQLLPQVIGMFGRGSSGGTGTTLDVSDISSLMPTGSSGTGSAIDSGLQNIFNIGSLGGTMG